MTQAVTRLESQEPEEVSVARVATSGFSLVANAMSIEETIRQNELLREFVARALKDGIDYGVIPGTERTDPKTGEVTGKKVLHKPGAEHLCQLFRLRPNFVGLSIREDFETGLFLYRYECQLIHIQSGLVVGTGIGSCTTFESKYRWRKGTRKCPECGKEAIIKGKVEYGGGWVCFKKKDGCGAKWEDGDPVIESQIVDRVVNPDIIDTANTVDKMAQKRALIAATLITCGCSEYFTQDLEENETSEVGARKEAVSGTGTASNAKANHGSPPAPISQSEAPAPASVDAKQEPEAGSSPFTSPARGKAEILVLLNRALELGVNGRSAPRILSDAFETAGMSVAKMQTVTDLAALLQAHEKLTWMIAEAGKAGAK